jgi:hypothetical protein
MPGSASLDIVAVRECAREQRARAETLERDIQELMDSIGRHLADLRALGDRARQNLARVEPYRFMRPPAPSRGEIRVTLPPGRSA